MIVFIALKPRVPRFLQETFTNCGTKLYVTVSIAFIDLRHSFPVGTVRKWFLAISVFSESIGQIFKYHCGAKWRDAPDHIIPCVASFTQSFINATCVAKPSPTI
jgi:hypothetical protein